MTKPDPLIMPHPQPFIMLLPIIILSFMSISNYMRYKAHVLREFARTLLNYGNLCHLHRMSQLDTTFLPHNPLSPAIGVA